ncbi:MAG: O-antigen ligase family protein [Planctomycetota bacterium]
MNMPPIYVVAAGLAIGLLIFFIPRTGLFFIILGTLFIPEIPVGLAETGIGLSRPIEIRAEDIFIVIVALGWFIGLVAKRKPIKIPYNPINTLIIIFSALMIISTIWGVFKGTTTPTAGFFFTLKRIQYFLIFFMVIANIQTYKHFRFNTALLFILAAIVAVWGILDYYLDPTARTSGPFRRDQIALLGGFLLIITFLVMALILHYPRWQSYVFLLPLLLISVYAVAFTRSRASYVGLLSGLIVFPFLSKKLYLLSLPALLLFAMIYLLPASVQEATFSIQGVWSKKTVANPSWESRIAAWEASIPKISDNPLLGLGQGSVPLSWTDNQYVTDLLYMGVIGLGLFIWLIIRIYLSVKLLRHIGPATYPQLKNIPENRESNEMLYYFRTLAIGYTAALAALLVQGFAVANFYTVRIMIPFWFLTGLMMVALNLVNQNLSNIKDPGISGT